MLGVKICGITTMEEIEILNKYPVNYVGFVFAKSKRQVSKAKVKKLISALNKNIKTVGVFINPVEEVLEISKYLNLDIVQLHGNEDKEYVDRVRQDFNVWKCISIDEEFNIPNIEADGYLLDTYKNGKSGGTGSVFDWSLVSGFSKDNFTILAGGLRPENVLKAIKVVNPHCIDLSSGVETNGSKDEKKIKDLFERLDDYEKF